MRIGSNPNIHKTIALSSHAHRVIIPVYIPNAEGYFAEAFSVFKVCMQSLLQTINQDTAVSIISNACSSEVNAFIYQLWEEKKIDRAIFNTENVGKMNAIIAETRASFEEYITYSDADVFFDKGWLQQTFQIFNEVPKAGFVSMNPTPKNYIHADSTILSNWNTILFKKKKTKEVCNYQDLEHFHKSIGKDKKYTEDMFAGNVYTLTKHSYILGAGHFCCTIKKTPTLKFVPKHKSLIGVSGGSESVYLDIPFDKSGLFRLSSPKAFVWHMGNVLEKDWTAEKLLEIKNFKEEDFSFHTIHGKQTNFIVNWIPYVLRNKMVLFLKKIKVLS